MKNELQVEEIKVKNSEVKTFKIKNKKETNNSKDQIFKIVLTGILLGIAVAVSLLEIKIPIMGAIVPLRIFDTLIMAIAIPIIGIWYTLAIAIIEPWLHFALDSDHPPIQMFFDNIANVVFVLSFVLIYYKLFKLNTQPKDNEPKKALIVKNTFAGLVVVPLNAIVSSLCFVFTMLVLAGMGTSGDHHHHYAEVFHGDHHDIFDGVTAFFENAPAIFFILLAIEIARFLFVYVLFALIQRRLGQLNHYQNSNNTN